MTDCDRIIIMNLRIATQNDNASLVKIYAQYINTPVTFEYDLPTEHEFCQRIADILKKYPYLVCEDKGTIIGYAYAHRQKERAAYQWNAELSVYLDRSFTSQGIGTALYRALLPLLEMQGIKTVYAGITLPNEKSERLHERFGFTRIGISHATGFKCGSWHDVIFLEKQIAPYHTDPATVIPFNELDQNCVADILNRAFT